MDTKLDELKAKAEEMLKACRDENRKQETYEAVKAKLTGFLGDVKKLNDSDKNLSELADQVRAQIVSFMEKDLDSLKKDAQNKIRAAVDEKTLQDTKVFFLGKKGKLTAILRGMKDVSAAQRPVIGALANQVRSDVEAAIADKMEELKQKRLEEKIRHETVDITLPARHHKIGHLHPLDKALREIMKSFIRMGYSVEEGPEIEQDYYNFECLNLPKDHPARDMQDSFYITPEILLRTHTSPVQARTLRKHTPNSPIRMIAPGKVFRWDNDATHSPVFHQVEGLVIDKGITMADLKGTLAQWAKEFFGENTKVKFRPHHFPFTEPSAECDITCFKCGGKGCRVCKGSGWIEILGCGMVHPNVLSMCGIDPEEYTGFAFGVGLERIALLKYEIDDMRLLYENDIRFLKQF